MYVCLSILFSVLSIFISENGASEQASNRNRMEYAANVVRTWYMTEWQNGTVTELNNILVRLCVRGMIEINQN